MNSDTSRSNGAVDRRTFLKGAAGVAGVTAAGVGASAPAAAQSSFDGWFENVSNYDGVVDETGKSEVTVEVGAKGNDGSFAFGPAAVRVDPGTKVVWKWTGNGGSHNVVAEDGSFESKMTDKQGHTFSQTFDSKGVVKYACVPHKAMGMKGAVVVGDVEVSGSSSSGGGSSANGSSEPGATGGAGAPSGSGGSGLSDTLTLGFGGALVVGLLGLPLAEIRSRRRE
ncbi:halocyanin domain-containing protein [Halorussus sp. MSC15.2]|uniref:halocyanin domain-containing protein n=1 Tax=Halorussus sp. MSC15.2 TaxID=2283638 RepID=UPI0013D2F5BC|nr:halocyanin domain-containing protein [Halorussus sp. MSC15.2]NEU58176.1 halocyanin domain-containing protein [Halorussus sp. MSC15.2]